MKEADTKVNVTTGAAAASEMASMERAARRHRLDHGHLVRIAITGKVPPHQAEHLAHFTAQQIAVLTKALGRAPHEVEMHVAHLLGARQTAELLQHPNRKAIIAMRNNLDTFQKLGGHAHMSSGEFLNELRLHIAGRHVGLA